jgi:hypothetical protein
VVLGERDQEVQALPPERAQEPLTYRAGLRPLWGRVSTRSPQGAYVLVELRREDAIAVIYEETVGMVSRYRFAQLVESPLGHGVCGYVGMQATAGRMIDDDKHIEEAKAGRDHHTEIIRHDRLRMVADKDLQSNQRASTVRAIRVAWMACGSLMPRSR